MWFDHLHPRVYKIIRVWIWIFLDRSNLIWCDSDEELSHDVTPHPFKDITASVSGILIIVIAAVKAEMVRDIKGSYLNHFKWRRCDIEEEGGHDHLSHLVLLTIKPTFPSSSTPSSRSLGTLGTPASHRQSLPLLFLQIAIIN